MKNWKKGIALVVAAGLLTIAGAATALAASRPDWIPCQSCTGEMMAPRQTGRRWMMPTSMRSAFTATSPRWRALKTKKDSFDMEKKMTKEGDYTFKVRALAKSNSKGIYRWLLVRRI